MQMLVALFVAAVVTFLIFECFEADAAPAEGPLAPSDRGFALLSDGLLMQREHGGRLTQLPGMATSAAYQADGSLLYFVQDGDAGTLFRREAGSGHETRLLQRAGLHLSDLCLSPDGSLVAAASRQPDGASRIVLFRADGSDFRELADGDSADRSPAWIPGAPKRLLFQSAPLRRDAQGAIAAHAPASLRMLNLDNGNTSAILAEAESDLLRPRVDPAGKLLFIRRAYAGRHGIEALVFDTLKFPLYLLRVAQDLIGIRTDSPVHGVPSRAPCSSHLVCRDTDGEELVFATHVACYDQTADGTIVYSDGQDVFVLDPNGTRRLAMTQPLVAEVITAG